MHMHGQMYSNQPFIGPMLGKSQQPPNIKGAHYIMTCASSRVQVLFF